MTWTEEVQRWLEGIFEYIAAENPRAAGRMVKEIFQRAQVLATFQEIGYRCTASPRHVRILHASMSRARMLRAMYSSS